LISFSVLVGELLLAGSDRIEPLSPAASKARGVWAKKASGSYTVATPLKNCRSLPAIHPLLAED